MKELTLWIDHDMESLLALFTKEYEVTLNRDSHDNNKDKVWVVRLNHYVTECSNFNARGLLNQSLEDLLVNIYKELYLGIK